MLNSVISKEVINNLVVSLFKQMYSLIFIENKKNEVDEILENIAILYKKKIVEEFNTEIIDNMNIIELIHKLSNSKSKNYQSLSSKSIFKFMDLTEEI
jgi:ABC-type dipeptide/oligopeptide/nickel transport system ATPase subunit